jgi:branched-chain amino acid aminotransferase
MPETLDILVQPIAQSRIEEVDFQNLVFGRTFSDHMFVAEYENGQWQDLRIVPYGKIGLDPALMALHYGQSIFEGMKAFRTEEGKAVLFRPEKNWARMNKSAHRMCMPELPEEVFMGGIKQLVQMDQAWIPSREGSSLYIRPFMFASDEYIGMQPSEKYMFVIFTCPVAAYYANPVSVKIETHYVRAAEGGIGSAKTAGNYAASMYPAQLAQKAGYDQLVWTDAKTNEFVEESGTMNLGFVINGKFVTPPTGDTILDGITRMSVLQLAQDFGLEVEERQVSVKEIMQAHQNGELTEAFGIGTAATISPIKCIGYEGKDYEIQPLTEQSFGTKVKKYLTDLCKGRVKDNHSWLTEIL